MQIQAGSHYEISVQNQIHWEKTIMLYHHTCQLMPSLEVSFFYEDFEYDLRATYNKT